MTLDTVDRLHFLFLYVMLNKNNIKQIYLFRWWFLFFLIDNYDSNIVAVNNSALE